MSDLTDKAQELRSKGLTWAEVGQQLGVDGEILRYRVLRARRKAKPEVTLEDAIAAERARMQTGRSHSEDRFTLQTRVMTDSLIEAAKELVPQLPKAKVPVLPAPKTDSRPQTAFAFISDSHIGAKVDFEETGGFGSYSYPKFQERLDNLQTGIRSITAHHRMSHPVPRLVAPLGGDLIENITIFPSQGEMVDTGLMEQVFYAVEDFARFYVGLLDTFETIFVPVITGNHGRIGFKGQHKRHVNWDYFIGKTLQYKLAPYADRITVEVPKAPFTVIDIEGWKFLLRHGDGIKSWGGIPYYGINRSTGRWIAIQSAIGSHFDYMVMGHFHAPANLPFTGGETIINGCFPGTTEYSVEVIESLTEPMQFFGMVHPVYGLAARYPILLDREHRRRAAA